MRHHAEQLVQLLSRIADSRELLPGAILFEHIITITTLIRNVTSRQAAVHAQLFPQVFRGHDQPRLGEVLAKYDVYFQDIHEADTYPTAAVAVAYDVLNRLNPQHMEQLQQLHDQAVFVTTAERRPAATPVQQSIDAHISSTPSLHETPVAQHARVEPYDRPPLQQSFQASRAPSRAPYPVLSRPHLGLAVQKEDKRDS
ncbi:unnamed protein product [Heligmosomoides polygyrus]|uniref:Rho-GAP domain-containing protein n=1 Tax=Heligmosomoides polygyrus TaxID=6339 RepID=A0A183F2B2_HELPZ|nr:unnamed protein product [Heligmosomoides polygyrus]